MEHEKNKPSNSEFIYSKLQWMRALICNSVSTQDQRIPYTSCPSEEPSKDYQKVHYFNLELLEKSIKATTVFQGESEKIGSC